MAKQRLSLEDLNAMGLYKQADGSYRKVTVGERSVQFSKPIHITNTVSISAESVLTIDGIVAGLNGSKGLMRGHWSNIKKQKDLYQMIIAQHLKDGKVKKHIGEVTVQYIGYKSSFMDWDNFCASFKHIGDSLQKCGIITNDSPKVIRQFIPNQIKCKRNDQKVVVIIKDI